MVKTIRTRIYECEICGEKFFERGKAIRHESKKSIPKYKVSESVNSHYPLKGKDGLDYAFTTFKVLNYAAKKHSFEYTLVPTTIQQYHKTDGGYTSPIIFKSNSEWKADNEEDKAVLNSLEGRLREEIIMPEERLRKELRFG